MLLLLEGPDGAGKTSLARAIAEKWDGPTRIIHKGPPEDPHSCPFTEYEGELDAIRQEVFSPHTLVVLDRWHVGDVVYGPEYRGFARFTPAGMLHAELALSSLGALKVICLAPPEVLRSRLEARGNEEYIRLGDLPRLCDEYSAHAVKYGYLVISHLSSTGEVASDLVSRLERMKPAERLLSAQLAVATQLTYTGSLSPAVVFTGEELGGSLEKGTRLSFTRPFTPAKPWSSSSWLLDAIIAGGMASSCGILNACHPGMQLERVKKLLPEARWVALGNRASTALMGARIKHDTAWHPQFARRFRHSHISEYIEQLREAAGFTTSTQENEEENETAMLPSSLPAAT